MNIQIFGKKKCFDTKKAERYFKERNIKYQFIDLIKFGMSAGEFKNIKSATGDINALIDEKAKDYTTIKYLAYQEDVEEKLLNNQKLFKTPIVRNGKKVTIGYEPEIWKTWE